MRILSLDGGGYLGLATASFLEETERHFGRSFYESFDMFCGTSTGAIIALAVALFLNRHFPHICNEDKAEDIRTILDKDPDFVTDTDLVIVALGDETLELYLNDLLGEHMPRIHTWVEPLGIGGHVLATGLSSKRGCFRCLFDTDDVLGIHNQAAFAAPGQNFQPSFAGCAGTFTPFAALDAERSANEAARLASRILLKRETSNLLISWRGDNDDFCGAGFQLSARGKMLKPGDRKIETSFGCNF
jgi:hypothetical protein